MSNATPEVQPYYLRSFELPLKSIYERYQHLWTPTENELYEQYTAELSQTEKMVFIKLLLRSHNNVYEINEVCDRHQHPVRTEIAEDKAAIDQAVRSLVKRRFLYEWDPKSNNQRDDINALKSLALPALKTFIQGLPDGKEVLKKYRKKEELIIWLVNRLDKFGNVPNPFTKKTFADSVWERFQVLDIKVNKSQLRFLVNKGASRFFKRLHLLNHVFVSTISPGGAGSDAISERIESILTESLKPGILEEIGSLEYVKCSRSSCLRINKYLSLFDSRAELENYENALGAVQRLRGDLNKNEVHELARICIRHLMAYALQNELTVKKWPNWESSEQLLKSYARFSSDDIVITSPKERLTHHVFRRFTPEYLYSIVLYELAQLMEVGLLQEEGVKQKEYELAVSCYSLIIIVNATRMNRGKIFLRLLIDTRLHLSQPHLALAWALKLVQEIETLEPGFIVDISKQIKLILGKKGQRKVVEGNESPPKRARVDYVGFKGIYNALCDEKYSHSLDFALRITDLEKQINSLIPLKIIRGHKYAVKSVSVTTSPASSDIEESSFRQTKFLLNGEWVSVEQFALAIYLTYSSSNDYIVTANHGFYVNRRNVLRNSRSFDIEDTSKGSDHWVGCHCEGSVIREIVSLVLFPLVFSGRVCAVNSESFITDTQTASCDLGTLDFYEVRKNAIHSYLLLWTMIKDPREIGFLISFLASQLYEVRVLSATWSLDVNHPNAFKPEIPADTVQNVKPPLPPLLTPSPKHLVTPMIPPMSAAKQENLSLRKTPTNKWQTPRFRGRLPLRKVGQTKETNLVLGYDRGVSLLPGESLPYAIKRRFESGLAYGCELSKVACGIPIEGLAQIALHMCKCFPYWSNGLPDLLMWKKVGRVPESNDAFTLSYAAAALVMTLIDPAFVNQELVLKTIGIDVEEVDLESWITIVTPSQKMGGSVDLLSLIKDDEAQTILVKVWQEVSRLDLASSHTVLSEVKGPGDALSQKQRLWLHIMLESGVSAHVCEVCAT